MDPPRISQQTSTTLPLTGQRPAARDAPGPKALRGGTLRRTAAVAAGGAGLERAASDGVDFVLLCAAVVLALGGVRRDPARLRGSARRCC